MLPLVSTLDGRYSLDDAAVSDWFFRTFWWENGCHEDPEEG
jgi:hypothetical protein